MKKKLGKKSISFLLSLLMLAAGVLCIPQPAKADYPIPTMKLSSVPAGIEINFAGYTWCVLDPATGYVIYATLNAPYVPFATGSTSVSFNPADRNNIAYYLNNTFTIPAQYLPLIQTHSWTTGSEINESSNSVDCKIGLLSYSEYQKYKSLLHNYYSTWLRTPSSITTGYVWYNGIPNNLYSSPYNQNNQARPTLYLDPDVAVGVDNVVSWTKCIAAINVVNGVPFSVKVDCTFGILSGTATTTYGTVTGTTSGLDTNSCTVISGTLSGLSTTSPTCINLGAGIIEVKAVDPPSTTVMNAKFY